MGKEDLPEIYSAFEKLLELGHSPLVIAKACIKVSEAFPNESRCWLIASRCFQQVNETKGALDIILEAIALEPQNMEYTFQLFNVYIQTGRADAISGRINNHWKHYDETAKALLSGYLTEAMATGLVVKHGLSVEVLSYILNKK